MQPKPYNTLALHPVPWHDILMHIGKGGELGRHLSKSDLKSDGALSIPAPGQGVR
jgi:hypothetical protein